MNFKKNPYVVIALCVALFVAIIIIVVLMLSKNSPADGSKNPSNNKNPHANLQPSLPSKKITQNQPQAPIFQDTPVRNNKPAIVLFYTDKCVHSRNMMPSWQQMKQSLEQTNQFDVISLEATQYPQEMQKHGINGYPMIRLYPEGFPGPNPIDYRGNRTTDSLIKFVKSGGKEV